MATLNVLFSWNFYGQNKATRKYPKLGYAPGTRWSLHTSSGNWVTEISMKTPKYNQPRGSHTLIIFNTSGGSILGLQASYNSKILAIFQATFRQTLG
jgi:hypothetical protein